MPAEFFRLGDSSLTVSVGFGYPSGTKPASKLNNKEVAGDTFELSARGEVVLIRAAL